MYSRRITWLTNFSRSPARTSNCLLNHYLLRSRRNRPRRSQDTPREKMLAFYGGPWPLHHALMVPLESPAAPGLVTPTASGKCSQTRRGAAAATRWPDCTAPARPATGDWRLAEDVVDSGTGCRPAGGDGSSRVPQPPARRGSTGRRAVIGSVCARRVAAVQGFFSFAARQCLPQPHNPRCCGAKQRDSARGQLA
jgi:hypothetical protein